MANDKINEKYTKCLYFINTKKAVRKEKPIAYRHPAIRVCLYSKFSIRSKTNMTSLDFSDTVSLSTSVLVSYLFSSTNLVVRSSLSINFIKNNYFNCLIISIKNNNKYQYGVKVENNYSHNTMIRTINSRPLILFS